MSFGQKFDQNFNKRYQVTEWIQTKWISYMRGSAYNVVTWVTFKRSQMRFYSEMQIIQKVLTISIPMQEYNGRCEGCLLLLCNYRLSKTEQVVLYSFQYHSVWTRHVVIIFTNIRYKWSIIVSHLYDIDATHAWVLKKIILQHFWGNRLPVSKHNIKLYNYINEIVDYAYNFKTMSLFYLQWHIQHNKPE